MIVNVNSIVLHVSQVKNGIMININVSIKSIVCAKTKVWFKMDYHILHMFLLETILLFMTAIICYHYEKHGQSKKILGH